MKKLSLVRLASYAVTIGIAVLLRHQIRVIPVCLLGDDEVETLNSEPERRKEDHIVVSSAGFRDSKLSGAEIVALGQKKARDEGQKLDGFRPPEIALRVKDGRLLWILHYSAELGPWQFEIRIDDFTGLASYENTTAPI